jgi:hypothetical protein
VIFNEFVVTTEQFIRTVTSVKPEWYALLSEMIILVGKGGNALCTVTLIASCVGLQQGLPLGLLARWTNLPCHLPTKTPLRR